MTPRHEQMTDDSSAPVAAAVLAGRSSSPRSGHGIACSLLLLGALQGVPFVGRAPFHESLAAQRTLLRAADQEVEALLAQAKALREEAERDEDRLRDGLGQHE
eukprot:g28582.t1